MARPSQEFGAWILFIARLIGFDLARRYARRANSAMRQRSEPAHIRQVERI
jgi:hypothetical protein